MFILLVGYLHVSKHRSVDTPTSGGLVGKSFLVTPLSDTMTIVSGHSPGIISGCCVLSINLFNMHVYSFNFPLQNLKAASLKNLVLGA